MTDSEIFDRFVKFDSAQPHRPFNRTNIARFFDDFTIGQNPIAMHVVQNFSSHRPTITADVLSGKLAGSAWSAVRRWLGRGNGNESPQ